MSVPHSSWLGPSLALLPPRLCSLTASIGITRPDLICRFWTAPGPFAICTSLPTVDASCLKPADLFVSYPHTPLGVNRIGIPEPGIQLGKDKPAIWSTSSIPRATGEISTMQCCTQLHIFETGLQSTHFLCEQPSVVMAAHLARVGYGAGSVPKRHTIIASRSG